MTTKRKFKSDAFEAIHSSASALFKVGAIDKATMREFDALCLTPVTPMAPTDWAMIPGRRTDREPMWAASSTTGAVAVAPPWTSLAHALRQNNVICPFLIFSFIFYFI